MSIYLDYASTYPRKREIVEMREKFELTSYANVGRGRYPLAGLAEETYENSKKLVADWIGCDPLDVIYTYSATYGINLLALAVEHNGLVKKNDTILLSVSEHHANVVPWQMLAERVGARIEFIGIDEDYTLDLDDLAEKLDDSVKVVSLQWASNVTGAVHPVEKIREIIGPERLLFLDAAQMVLHGPINMQEVGCDALVFSGHKMMADTGIGVLALRKDLQKSWKSPISGGTAINFVHKAGYEQAGIPQRWEPGTPHITGALSLGAAIQYIRNISPQVREYYSELDWFTEAHFDKLAQTGLKVYHSKHSKALGIWSFVIPDKNVNDIADAFAEKDICVRAGHHCAEPLHDALHIRGSVRMCIGFDTTKEEVEKFFEVLTSLLPVPETSSTDSLEAA